MTEEAHPQIGPEDKQITMLIRSAYICTGLSIIPVLNFFTAMAALVLGIVLCIKGKILHGIVNIVSAAFLSVLVPVLIILLLTGMKSNIQATFDEVTKELEAEIAAEEKRQQEEPSQL